MGMYINPVNQTKEEWLESHGAVITEEVYKNLEYNSLNNCLPVCLIDNGFFTAAGIAYNAEERDAFINPMDDRPKRFYLCNIDELLEVSDLDVNMISKEIKYEKS